MTKITTINTQPDWDSALARLPYAHVLQSWHWGDFKTRWGWSAERLLWQQGDTPVAAAQVLARPIPRTPWRFLYVSKGPSLNYADASLATQVLADLEQHARQANALFIKIDPDVVRTFGDPAENPPPDDTGQAMLKLLDTRGWRFSPEQIQFRNTVIINLEGEPDEWQARMKSKWRYNIRYAERKGVTIRTGTEADIAAFYKMYAETAARDGFLIRPEAYYRDVWGKFLAADQAEILLAEVEGDLVAGLVLFVFGESAWYLYGASSGQHRNLMPNHLLQWVAMCRAKELGCTRYDMWGAPDVFDESDSMWGVYRFKQGFGGKTIQGLGAFDYPVQPKMYSAFTQALPRARSLMRRLKRR